ncbi:Meiotic recombination protein dmc1 [Rhizoctonia solani AG-1 IB]|uniref:Meiotic recombination protein dmc1 n=1 Tax=Thanatephorus cucumeris (strain AG1-IB / isolate 7/3/14) TaxID=1108050 RepID=M5CEP5_THACB|nr:Meiotic recombination protein dmc1 [Rhizoctonia solani AG-1 IB]
MPVPAHDESRPSTPPPDDIDSGINAQDITKLKARLVHHHVSYSLTVLATERRHMRRVCRAHDLAQEPAQDQDADHTITITLGLVVPDRGAVSDKRKRMLQTSSGSKSVDGMLGGRFMSQSISEVYGESRLVDLSFGFDRHQAYDTLDCDNTVTGKKQLAHTLSVMARLPSEMGGASGKVTYIDTEGTFRPDRIRAIAEWFGVDAEQALENITYACAYNSEHQMELIQEVEIQFAGGKKFRLLLAYMLAKLCKLPEEFNIVVLLTNQVQADPGAKIAFAPIVKPIGGHILSHASATRIMLRKGHGEERVAKRVDSPDRSESEGSYKLAEGCWTDV